MTLVEPFFLLLLLLIPLVVVGGILAATQRKLAWEKLVAPRLRHRLAAPSSQISRWLSLGTGLLGLTLIVVCLAQPVDEAEEVTALVKGRNIIIAVDASRSMLTEDMAPDRLTAAKSLVYDLLEGFPNDRIGILAFAGSAVVQAPLTIDHNALRETLEQLDESNVPSGGSNLAEAINLATRTFQETGQRTHGLIVISDGELHEGALDDASFDAKKAGVMVVAIGMGSREGDFVPDASEKDGRFRDRSGKPVLSRLNPEPLRTLAAETGGLYLDGAGGDFAKKIDTVIGRLDAFEDEERVLKRPVPRFQWFLIPAMVLLVASILFRFLWSPARPHAVAAPPITACVALFAFFALAPDAQAWTNPLDNFLGSRALKKGENEEALEHFAKADEKGDPNKLARVRFAQGIARYREKDYIEAASAFSEALRSDNPRLQRDAHSQLANTLYHRAFKKGSDDPGKAVSLLEDAIDHYDSALEITSDHKPSLKNKEAAEEALKQMQQQQQQQQQENEQNQEQQQDQEGGESQESSEGEQGEEGEESENSENSQGQPQSGDQDGEEGDEQNQEPQSGGEQPEDEEGDPQEGENGEQKKDEEGQNGDQEEGDEQGDESDSGEEEEGQNGQEPGDQEGDGRGQSGLDRSGQEGPAPREDETAEEFARRILKENADFQKEALRKQGRQVTPTKDW